MLKKMKEGDIRETEANLNRGSQKKILWGGSILANS